MALHAVDEVVVALLAGIICQPPPKGNVLCQDLRSRHLADQNKGELLFIELDSSALDNLPPQLKELEDLLLAELSKETDIPLVDNDPLIAVLDDAKTKSVMISEALENAKITNENID